MNYGYLRPWGSTSYGNNPSHKQEKIVPCGKKYIFIQYYKHSKRYVFIGENIDRSISKIESRDATFLEHDFPMRGALQKDFQHMEMDDPNSESY